MKNEVKRYGINEMEREMEEACVWRGRRWFKQFVYFTCEGEDEVSNEHLYFIVGDGSDICSVNHTGNNMRAGWLGKMLEWLPLFGWMTSHMWRALCVWNSHTERRCQKRKPIIFAFCLSFSLHWCGNNKVYWLPHWFAAFMMMIIIIWFSLPLYNP